MKRNKRKNRASSFVSFHFVCFVLAVVLFVSLPTLVTSVGSQQSERVQDASLKIKDLRGREQSPFKLDGAKASVLIFLAHDCPISNRYAPEINRLARDYQTREARQIRFYLVYVDQTAEAKEIESHLREYGLSEMIVILDSGHTLSAATGVTITPEVAVVGEQGRIFYRGRIDNLYAALGKPRRQVTEHNLRDALEAILNDKEVAVPRTQAIGCYITSQG